MIPYDDYTVVKSGSLNKLIAKVKELSKEGWIVSGGISISSDPIGHTYAQALIYPKPEKEPK